MISLLDVILLSIAILAFTVISWFWKIKVRSYLRLMILVDIMVLTPMIVSIIDLPGFLGTGVLLFVEIIGILLIGYFYDNQIGLPYRRMFAGMVRAQDNKDLNIQSTSDINITGEMLRLQSKQIQFVEEIANTLQQLSEKQENIDGYLGRLRDQSMEMSGEIDTITDDVDQILQNASIISENANELKTRGIEFIDSTDSNFKILIEIANSTDRIADQVNIIAVNAAIEAAETSLDDTNFGVVADGIQSIAKRSKETTDKLKTEIRNLRRTVIEEIRQMNEKLTKLDESIFELGEIANKTSSFTHHQQSFVREISAFTEQTQDENDESKSLTKTYKTK